MYLSQLWSLSSSPLPAGEDRESEAGCSPWSWAGAQACQEKPPCLLVYAANTPRAGARRAGQGGRLWGFGPGSSLKGTLGIGPSPPSPWARRPETYVLEGQEDGEEESTEEKGHEQYKEHTLAGGEVKLQDIGGHQH